MSLPAAALKLHPEATSRISLSAILLTAMFLLCYAGLGLSVIPVARQHDFLNLYTGASLARDGRFADMHDPQVQLSYERRFAPKVPDLVPFVRPHAYALFLSPIAFLPYNTAFGLWLTIHIALLLACLAWGARRFGPDALVLGAMYVPPSFGIAHGQDCVFLLVIMIGSFALFERHRLLASGAVLGLALIKFHLILLLPLALIYQRRWRMLAGFSVTGAALAAISLVLGGWQGVQGYAALLQRKDLERLSPSPERMMNLYSILVNFGVENIWVTGALIVLVLVSVALVLRGGSWPHSLLAASLGSLLIAPHVYGYDCALLLLGLWIAMFLTHQPVVRVLAASVCTPLAFGMGLAPPPFPATAALLLLALLVALAVAVQSSDRIFRRYNGVDAS